MANFGKGLNWAVGKCILSNFVALTVYEAACVALDAKQPLALKKDDPSQKPEKK
jgi:hypothetical protein